MIEHSSKIKLLLKRPLGHESCPGLKNDLCFIKSACNSGLRKAIMESRLPQENKASTTEISESMLFRGKSPSNKAAGRAKKVPISFVFKQCSLGRICYDMYRLIVLMSAISPHLLRCRCYGRSSWSLIQVPSLHCFHEPGTGRTF